MSGPTLGLVAAAGRSSRMGQPKALLEIEGEPFVRRLSRVFLEAGVSKVVVTVPKPPADEAVREALVGLDVVASPNRYFDEGLLGSLKTALELLPNARGIVLTPVDAPFASVELVRALLYALERGARAAVPSAGGRRGHPVGFSAACFEALRAAEGGPREVLASLGDTLALVPWGDERVTWNLNAPADLARAGLGPSSR